MKHFSAACRMRSRWRAARVAASGRVAASVVLVSLLMGADRAAVLRPAAAERFVQGHAIVLQRKPRRDQPLLRAVEAALRVKQRQIAVGAGLIAPLRKIVAAPRSIHQRFLRPPLTLE